MLASTKKVVFLRTLLKGVAGQAIVEYSLILVLISLAVFSIAKLLGANIVVIITNVISSF